jgi:hypothetical protein
MAHTFDRDLFAAGFFQPLGQALGKRHYLPLRPAGSDEHEIGDIGFALQIDGGDVFRLTIVEQLLGQLEQLLRRRRFRFGRLAPRFYRSWGFYRSGGFGRG